MRLFISSTFRDLRAEREAAAEALRRSQLVPWGMELFVSEPENLKSCQRPRFRLGLPDHSPKTSWRRSVPGQTTCRTNFVDRRPMWFSFEDKMRLTLHEYMWAGEGPGLAFNRRPIAWEVLGMHEAEQAWIANIHHAWQILRADNGVYGEWSGKFRSLDSYGMTP
jgi:uncharacterized protein DUF4062